MKSKMESYSVQTIDEFKSLIQLTWDELEQEIIKNTINHLIKLCKDIETTKGEFT